MTPNPSPNRQVLNLEGESLGLTVAQYDAARPKAATAKVHTLCHAPFTTLDLGPQGQVTTCNHFHRFLGNLNERSWLEIFRGEDWSRLRQNMLDYRISESDCRHCARQIRSGHPGNAFAQEHFDVYPADTAKPKYPTVIIFRLSNVCNLMCVMCNGTLSHRIRKEREQLPPLPPPPYEEQFFAEMEATLPHVRYVEFYGGEPFLVKEHLRILDILEKTGAKTEIYVNTNGTAITDRIKGYIERLNFVKIAVSVDAIYEHIHARQRVGIKHDVCMANLQWMLDLRQRKNVWVGLNTTETRFNWYHLPVMYEWAAEKDVYIHINTCLHPSDTTLYDLPTEELAYVGDYFARWRRRLGAALEVRGNHQSYGHLEAMVRDELTARRNGTKRPNPYPTDREPMYGGLLWVPELGIPPFDTPAAAQVEIEKVQEFAAWDHALRMGRAWRAAIAERGGAWAGLGPALDALIERAEPVAEHYARQRRAEDDQRALRAGWKHEAAGEFAQALQCVAAIGEGSRLLGSAELLRARCLRRLGRFDQAEAAMQRAFTLAPTQPSNFVEMAWQCFDTNQVEAGLTHARRARDLAGPDASPDDTANWSHVLGCLAVRAGLAEEAVEALRALEQVRPDAPPTVELRHAIAHPAEVRDRLAIHSGERLENAGLFAEAVAALRAVRPDSPFRYDAMIPEARALRRAGKPAEARRVLDAACALAPDRAHAWSELAWLEYHLGEVEQGLGHARRARGLSGNEQAAAHAHAVLAIAAGDSAGAVDALAVIHAHRPLARRANPGGEQADAAERAAIARAWERESQGDASGILACLAAIPDGSPWGSEALVLRARAERRQGDFPRARRTLAQSIAIEPVQLEALVELAWMHLDVDELKAGLDYALRARELSARNRDPYGIVGWAHPLAQLAVKAGAEDLAAECEARLRAVRGTEAAAEAALAQIAARRAAPAPPGS